MKLAAPIFRVPATLVLPAQLAALLAALLLAPAPTARAGAEKYPKTPSSSGKKKLLLFAKDPATWAVLAGGGSGKLVYREASGAFTLNAAGLQTRSSYALIRFTDAPPGAEILARGISDGSGRLELSGTWRNWSKKFWLVAGEDVAGAIGAAGSLRDWRPKRYLFEEKPLGVACACPEPEEP